MSEDFIPDYSKYDNEFLVDVYSRINRENSPEQAKALDSEIKKRFNLPQETDIDPKVVMGFINTFQAKSKKTKSKLTKSEEMIKQGWIAGIIIGSISFLSWLIAMLTARTSVQGLNFSVFNIVDILGIFALSYGIYLKSRTCAVVLASYFILIKIFQLISNPLSFGIFGLIGLLTISPFLIRGAIGTFQYQKLDEETT